MSGRERALFGAYFFVLVLVATITVVVGASTAQASVTEQTGTTVLIGDSTSARMVGRIKARHPSWHLDALGGSSVKTLDDRIAAYLTVDPEPALLVMALGTNPDPEQEWSAADFTAALDLLPASTDVALVLPVRAGLLKGECGAEVGRYARWLRSIAEQRPRTVIADWRGAVLKDKSMNQWSGVGRLTVDGTHQTNPAGRKTWLNILDRAIRSFSH